MELNTNWASQIKRLRQLKQSLKQQQQEQQKDDISHGGNTRLAGGGEERKEERAGEERRQLGNGIVKINIWPGCLGLHTHTI